MKKVKIKGKLSLDKMTISKLNDEQTNEVIGGGFLSIGGNCTLRMDKCKHPSKGIWCNHK